MKIKVFVEYQISAEKQNQFRSLIPELKRELSNWNAKDIKWFEGTDQPLLMVEDFYIDDIEDYHKIKQQRELETAPCWKLLHQCIQGGAGKVHIWAFSEIRSD